MRIDCKSLTCLLRFSLCAPILLGSWPQIVQAHIAQVEGTAKLKSEIIEIHFAKGSSVIDTALLDNRVMINELSRFIEEHREVIERIEMNSTSSPEGSALEYRSLYVDKTNKTKDATYVDVKP